MGSLLRRWRCARTARPLRSWPPQRARLSSRTAARRQSGTGTILILRRLVPAMTAVPSVLRCRLALVTLRPLREDAVAVLGHPQEVILHHRLLRGRRIVRRGVLHARLGNDGVVLRIELARALRGAPVGD